MSIIKPKAQCILVLSLILLAFLVLIPSQLRAYGQGVKQDGRNDLIKCCTGDTISNNLKAKAGFVDILNGSVSVDSSALTLSLETKEPVPAQATNLVSYSFLLDLDGNKNTGFLSNQEPVGIFPELGSDLWVNYSLYQDEEKVFGYLGSPAIPNLNYRANLVDARIENDGHKLVFTIQKSRIEMILAFAYAQFDTSWKIKPEKMNWALLTNWAPLSLDNPIADVLPETQYEPAGTGCLTNPLVDEIIKEEKEEGRQEPPPPPPPPTPPS